MRQTSYRPIIQLDLKLVRELVRERAFLRHPLAVADVGARSVFDGAWEVFESQCILVGFEPDEKECRRIQAQYAEQESSQSPRHRIVNSALWEKPEKVDLYVTREVAASSCLSPNKAYFDRLPEPSNMDVQEVVEIEATTLDVWARQEGIDFDVIKLDVQGGELAVLKGGMNQLRDSALAVVVEVEFVELYHGQPLFAEVDQFMRAQGFNLFDLDIRRWRRKPLSQVFEGMRVG